VPDLAPLFDSLALAAVAAEIRACVGAPFGGVHQLSADEIVLGLGRRRPTSSLYFSIHPRAARVHFTSWQEDAERLGALGQLLRSRLLEARLSDVEQPPFDRILRLRFDGLGGPLWLVAEVMGRHSNLFLTDMRTVLGALKAVTAQMSPRRPVVSGGPYLPPPADRPRPDLIDPAGIRRLLTGTGSLEEQLTHSLLGLSPLMAREIALRAGVDPAIPAGEAAESAVRIWEALQEIVTLRKEDRWAPTLYLEEARIAAYAPFPMRVFERMRALPAASMSEAVDLYYRSAGLGAALVDGKRALEGAVRSALAQRERALESDRRAVIESRSAERFRVMGDLLLTYGGRAPSRATEITVPDHTAEGAEVTIPLDPNLTAAENAQRLFRRYAKARATARALPARIAHLEYEALSLREALVQIAAATSPDDLWEIHTDLAGRRLLPRAPRSRPTIPRGPRRYATEDGAVILVGRSGRENDHVTFHMASPDDLWFHARGMAGAHVVLKSGGEPRDASVIAAAATAAYFSDGRAAPEVAVDCVARKHVRKPRGAPPGTVVYEGERTLRVGPALPARVLPPAAPRPAPRSRPRPIRRSR
jgi:predicted ribosome quality control (RQC) complex YloA/Tae2 family protein